MKLSWNNTYHGIPVCFLFFRFVLWNILVITHYIEFTRCYWRGFYMLCSGFYNEGKNQVEMGRPFSFGSWALQLKDKGSSMGPSLKDRAKDSNVTVSPYCLAWVTGTRKPAEAQPDLWIHLPALTLELAGGKYGQWDLHYFTRTLRSESLLSHLFFRLKGKETRSRDSREQVRIR